MGDCLGFLFFTNVFCISMNEVATNVASEVKFTLLPLGNPCELAIINQSNAVTSYSN